MRTVMRIPLLILSALFVAAGARASHAKTAQPTGQSVQVIEMAAKKYVFTPSPLHVKRGTRVQLKITALDRNHGFKINLHPDGADSQGAPGLAFASPQKCWKIEKGKTTVIEFVAQTPGSYPFKCCRFCGIGHLGMKGQIIVDP